MTKTPNNHTPASSYRRRAQTRGIRNVQRYAEIPEAAKNQINKYCEAHKISVSEFLSEIVLRNVNFAGKPGGPKTIATTFDNDDVTTIKYHALMLGISPEELIQRAIGPILAKQKIHTNEEHTSLRYVVTKEEDKRIRAFMKKHQFSPRHYAGLLAVEVVAHYFSNAKERRNFPWTK